MLETGIGRAIRLATLGTAIGLLVACGGSSAASPTAASPRSQPAASTEPAPGGGVASTAPGGAVASEDAGGGAGGGPGASTDNGPIGGDIGDRSKGSIQAQVTGGLTASIDLPFGAPLAQLLTQGPATAYLPYTDTAQGTIFLTISADNQLLVQYAGPDNVGLTNGATPCDLHLDTIDAGQAKGSFTCKGMLLIKGESMGNADMTATFEAHK